MPLSKAKKAEYQRRRREEASKTGTASARDIDESPCSGDSVNDTGATDPPEFKKTPAADLPESPAQPTKSKSTGVYPSRKGNTTCRQKTLKL